MTKTRKNRVPPSPTPPTPRPPVRDSGYFRSLTLSAEDTTVDVSGTFNVSLSGSSNMVVVPYDANATEFEASDVVAQTVALEAKHGDARCASPRLDKSFGLYRERNCRRGGYV